MRMTQHIPSGDGGAVAPEYALLAALIAGVIAVTVATFGVDVAGLYNSVVGTF